jgi:P27 family predicted phage terminase small subunit
MPGPKPKPTAQKRFEGNPGHRPLPPNEPVPPSTPSTFLGIPEELTGDARASAEWVRLAPMLQRVRVVTDADRSALIACCVEWSRYVEAVGKIATLGMVVKAPSGYPIQNPYLPIATKALAGCTKLWQELGLTPASRARVKEAVPGEDPGVTDAFSEFDDVPAIRPQ